MKKIACTVVLSFLFVSCKQSEHPNANVFYFDISQPTNSSILGSIPNKFQGIYMSPDSLYLTITNNIIFSEKETKFRFHKKQIDSLKEYFDVVDGKYVLKDKTETFKSRKVGDSIELLSKRIDTIFKMSDSQIVKKIKSYLIVNQRDSIYWKVKILSLNRNSLIIRELSSIDDLRRMDSITKIHSKKIDSTTFSITPSRNEFKTFCKIKGLGIDSKFIKLK